MRRFFRLVALCVLPLALAAQQVTWSPAAAQKPLPEPLAAVRSAGGWETIEFNRKAVDFSAAVRITVAAEQVAGFALCSGGDAPTPLVFQKGAAGFSAVLPQDDSCYAIRLRSRALKSVTVDYTPLDVRRTVNMAPVMQQPKGRPRAVNRVCTRQGERITMDTGRVRAVFDTAEGLRLAELFLADVDRQVLKYPRQSELFRLQLDNKVVCSASSGKIEAVRTTAEGFTVRLVFPAGIRADFQCFRQGENIAMRLALSAAGPVAVKTAFPQLDGLVLSDKDNDYYCFPWGGGVIGDASAYLRSIYGENDAWWQMLDLFSPANGGGIFLHVQDPTGLAKAFSMRRGHTPPAENIIRPPRVAARNDLSLYFYQFHLPDGHGSAMAVDYQRATLKSTPLVYPVTVIGSHAGNWKAPMAAYAAWAKSVWKFRPYPGKLSQKFNCIAGFGCSGGLYTDRSWDREAFVPKNDVCEINGWWSSSPLAPWNTKWEDFAQLGKSAAAERETHFGYALDPFTNQPFYVFNRGDYDGYNPQWGGLPRFRAQLQEVRDKGKLSILYTDPILVCANTRYGRSEAAKHAVINPAWRDPHQCPKTPKEPEGVVCNYYSYCMCLNDSEYLTKVAQDIRRIIEETGADGVRLDEYGHRGYVCLSRTHKHIFGEHGQHVWLQALERSLQLIRDVTPPEMLLLTEFPQADFAAARLDGALSYDICRRQSPLRPLQVNLFRFYFPECRLFELNVGGPGNAKDIMFFNGDGVYNSGGRYSEEYSRILHDNTDCFTGNIEPLVETLQPLIYANRFAAADGNRVFYTLFNSTGKPFSGPVLPVPAGFECVQLLPAGNAVVRDGSVCIALAPDQLGAVLMKRKDQK